MNSFLSLFSPLLVFLKDQASSHLVDTIIQLAHKSLLRDLYKNHLRGQLVDLALHRIANFPVQRLAAASAKHKLVCVPLSPSQSSRPSKTKQCIPSAVPQVVRRADRRRGGHPSGGSHGSDRPAGRELRRERGEAGRVDAVPPQGRPLSFSGFFFLSTCSFTTGT